MRDKRGFIILAIVMSMLLVIAAGTVFSIVSGRFSITNYINSRIQAMRDAEAASYVTYQMIRENVSGWAIPASDKTTKTVTFKKPDGVDDRVTVTMEIYPRGTTAAALADIKAKVRKKL